MRSGKGVPAPDTYTARLGATLAEGGLELIRLVQSVDAVVALAFGIGLLIAPDVVLSIYGAHTDAVGVLVARLAGAQLLGYAAIDVLTLRVSASDFRVGIIRAEALVNAIAALAAIGGVLAGALNTLGWSLVATFVAFGALRILGTWPMGKREVLTHL